MSGVGVLLKLRVVPRRQGEIRSVKCLAPWQGKFEEESVGFRAQKVVGAEFEPCSFCQSRVVQWSVGAEQ